MDKNRMKLSKKERSKTTMKETGRTDKIYWLIMLKALEWIRNILEYKKKSSKL
jgi:hypothetical protein